MDKIKVAHIIRVFSYGGAEVLLREFFAQKKFKDEIISDLFILDHKKLGLVNDVKNNIRNIFIYKITTLKFSIEYFKFLRQLSKGKYDIAHMHLPVAGWMGIVAKLFCPKTKFIYTEHNPVTFYAKYNYYLNGLAYGFFDALIFMSVDAREVVEKIQNKFFHKTKYAVTILNGIDTVKYNNDERALKSNDDTWLVSLVARFRPQKRVDRWVEVAAAIRKKVSNITFIMAGDGPDDEMLREKIKENKVSECINLPGAVGDTFAVHKAADIFLMTSDFEGLPVALLEAMASGCVPVVHNVGGIQQLNIDEFGSRYDVFDADKVADIIIGLTKDPIDFYKKTLLSRSFVQQHYSLDKQVDETILLYKELILNTKN